MGIFQITLIVSTLLCSLVSVLHIDQFLDLWRTVGPCRYGDSDHEV